MQFVLTDEQQQVSALARALCIDFAPMLRETMATADGFDRHQWRTAVAEAGLGGIALPERLGGSGLGLVELALVMIEMGRTLWPSPFLPSIATASPLIAAVGSAAMAERWLPALADGTAIATMLATGDLALARDGAGWRVRASGFAPFAHVADLVVLAGSAGLVLLPTDTAGVAITRRASLDPTRPLSAVSVDALVPDGAVVRDATPTISAALDRARVALAAESLGGAEAALDRTVAYSRERVQFGRPIGSFQALKHRMADMMVANEAARSAVYYAAAAADEAHPETAEAAAIAHATAIEAFQTAAADMIQFHGGIGFTWEHDAHLFFKRARNAGTLLGTPRQSRARLARLIGLEAA